MTIAERIYGTASDPQMIAVKPESVEKLNNLGSKWFFYELDQNSRPISWIVVLPTQIELMKKFLGKEISEQQLLDQTKSEKHYKALYLCSAITIPEYRRQGLAFNLLTQAIRHYQGKHHTEQFFSWPLSPEGSALVYRLQKDLNLTIQVRRA